jgi:hypothetical protein
MPLERALARYFLSLSAQDFFCPSGRALHPGDAAEGACFMENNF